MTRDEYLDELRGLVDSFDDHVTGGDVVIVLELLAERIDTEGLE